jgi:hypothetical protein
MFSGLWAIANQEAQFNNKPPLGQAAPYLYSLPSSAIYDIVPVTSKNNVTATIKDATGISRAAYRRIGLAAVTYSCCRR